MRDKARTRLDIAWLRAYAANVVPAEDRERLQRIADQFDKLAQRVGELAYDQDSDHRGRA